MPKFIDLTGQRFGRLIVIQKTTKKHGKWFWDCHCDCGERKIIWGSALKANLTKSCGCLFKERILQCNVTHGMSSRPEYYIWKSIIQRCTNPASKDYHLYGGRGIRICLEWRISFESFFNYIGPRPASNLTIDRIDNNSDYKPGNVRWATMKEQMSNARPRRKAPTCSKGHLYFGSNLYISPMGKRRCRICDGNSRHCRRAARTAWMNQ